MEIVSSLRSALSERLGRDRYELWFGSAVRLELSEGVLHVIAPSPFVLDRVRSFRADLVAVAERVLLASPSIEFRVEERSSRSETPRGHEPVRIHEPTRAHARPHPASSTDRPAMAPTLKLASPTAPATDLPRRRFANLETFVVGESNRVAFTAAKLSAERPGAMSPLFVHGPTGAGKTHLLEGVWCAAKQQREVRRVVYLSAEQFTNQFQEALRGSGLPSFRRKCRDVQLLLIDDLQFFAGKRATLVELLHTIDALLREGRQLVLTADRSPADLAALGPELTARLSGGLVCQLDPPEEETRLEILRRLARQRGLVVPAEVLSLLARRLPGDARKLRGALNRLEATSLAEQRPISLDLATTALADLFAAHSRIVRLPDIERAVCQVFGLDAKSLQEGGKTRSVSQPRMLAMWLARQHTRAAFSEIGEYFGRRSHSTVISAQEKVNRWRSDGTRLHVADSDCTIDDAIRRIEAELRAG